MTNVTCPMDATETQEKYNTTKNKLAAIHSTALELFDAMVKAEDIEDIYSLIESTLDDIILISEEGY